MGGASATPRASHRRPALFAIGTILATQAGSANAFGLQPPGVKAVRPRLPGVQSPALAKPLTAVKDTAVKDTAVHTGLTVPSRTCGIKMASNDDNLSFSDSLSIVLTLACLINPLTWGKGGVFERVIKAGNEGTTVQLLGELVAECAVRWATLYVMYLGLKDLLGPIFKNILQSIKIG